MALNLNISLHHNPILSWRLKGIHCRGRTRGQRQRLFPSSFHESPATVQGTFPPKLSKCKNHPIAVAMASQLYSSRSLAELDSCDAEHEALQSEKAMFQSVYDQIVEMSMIEINIPDPEASGCASSILRLVQKSVVAPHARQRCNREHH
jgi:hypothetical protein